MPVDGMVDKSSFVVLMLQSTNILIIQHYLQVFSTSFNLYDMWLISLATIVQKQELEIGRIIKYASFKYFLVDFSHPQESVM